MEKEAVTPSEDSSSRLFNLQKTSRSLRGTRMDTCLQMKRQYSHVTATILAFRQMRQSFLLSYSYRDCISPLPTSFPTVLAPSPAHFHRSRNIKRLYAAIFERLSYSATNKVLQFSTRKGFLRSVA